MQYQFMTQLAIAGNIIVKTVAQQKLCNALVLGNPCEYRNK